MSLREIQTASEAHTDRQKEAGIPSRPRRQVRVDVAQPNLGIRDARDLDLIGGAQGPVPVAAKRTPILAAELGEEEAPKPMTPLRVDVAGSGPVPRAAIEALLGTDVKRWRFTGMSTIEGGQRLEYAVRLRKKLPPALLEARIRAAGGGAVRAVQIDAVPAP